MNWNVSIKIELSFEELQDWLVGGALERLKEIEDNGAIEGFMEYLNSLGTLEDIKELNDIISYSEEVEYFTHRDNEEEDIK